MENEWQWLATLNRLQETQKWSRKSCKWKREMCVYCYGCLQAHTKSAMQTKSATFFPILLSSLFSSSSLSFALNAPYLIFGYRIRILTIEMIPGYWIGYYTYENRTWSTRKIFYDARAHKKWSRIRIQSVNYTSQPIFTKWYSIFT